MNARERATVAWRLALLAALGGCAGGGLRVSDITPQAIPELEAARGARPGDATVLGRLGVAYFKAQRFPEARRALDSAVGIDPRLGIGAIYLGMTSEALGDFTSARTAYQQYISVARSGELRDVARQRLALVGRHEMEYQARAALAQESTLAQQQPEVNTVAVMPFGYSGANEQIRPLGRGFAQLVVTDLARSRQLRVLERERMQAMLDEMRLADSARADPAAALRSGRLLRAGRVVQGTIAEQGDNLRVDAAVVDVATAGVAASAGASDLLNRLFDLEKQLVLSIFANLGIQLSDAERAAIEQRQTQNLQAFLAYSRGLESQDRGDFAAAQAAFDEAAGLDPGFLAAQLDAQAAGDLSAASQQTTGDVEAVVVRNERVESGAVVGDQERRGALRDAANSVVPSQGMQVAAGETPQSEPPKERDTTAETTNTEGPRPATGTVVIVIRRPQ